MEPMPESCAACGKHATEGLKLKACTACKLVKYCGRDCQVSHRPIHKKACKRKAIELLEWRLFVQPPPRGDCPICFLRMPPDRYCIYMVCCGKLICDGCDVCLTRDRCPFCNAPRCKSYEEYKKKIFERIEKYNDSEAMNNLGRHYYLGQKEFPVDYSKAIELFQRASQLGSATAHYNLANVYTLGNGVEKDKKKAMHHWQEAAILGHEIARHNLAVEEGHWELGKVKDDAYQANISLNHYMIAAEVVMMVPWK